MSGVGVVGPELPLGVVAEPLLEQRAEDLRVDLAPVEPARDPQESELLGVEMHVRGALEEAAVGVRDAGVEAVLRPRAARVVQGLEQPAEIVGARAPAVGQEIVDESG
jgi:hypothetical protein